MYSCRVFLLLFCFIAPHTHITKLELGRGGGYAGITMSICLAVQVSQNKVGIGDWRGVYWNDHVHLSGCPGLSERDPVNRSTFYIIVTKLFLFSFFLSLAHWSETLLFLVLHVGQFLNHGPLLET